MAVNIFSLVAIQRNAFTNENQPFRRAASLQEERSENLKLLQIKVRAYQKCI